MKAIEETPNLLKTNVEKLASKILAIFSELEPDSQKTAVLLYRLLNKGNSVSREELAHAVGISVERINDILENWTGVYYKDDQIIGFWGLTLRPVMSMMEPKVEIIEDIVSNFCHYIHFFPSVEVGQKWTAKNPGTTILSIEDAFELGKKRNNGQFKEALQ